MTTASRFVVALYFYSLYVLVDLVVGGGDRRLASLVSTRSSFGLPALPP